MELLKADEVAKILRVRVSRVYELAAQQILPTVRLGRQLRFDPAAIAAFVKHGGFLLDGGWRRGEDIDGDLA